MTLLSAAAIRMTAKPTMSTYSSAPLVVPSPIVIVMGYRRVTLRGVASPFEPVTRTTKRWTPFARPVVPIVRSDEYSFEFLPSGVTVDGENEAVTPPGSGLLRPSRLSDTEPPNAWFWASLTAIRNAAGAPDVTVWFETSEVMAKSRLTDPILTASGSCLVVRYGLPAWPRIQTA